MQTLLFSGLIYSSVPLTILRCFTRRQQKVINFGAAKENFLSTLCSISHNTCWDLLFHSQATIHSVADVYTRFQRGQYQRAICHKKVEFKLKISFNWDITFHNRSVLYNRDKRVLKFYFFFFTCQHCFLKIMILNKSVYKVLWLDNSVMLNKWKTGMQQK